MKVEVIEMSKQKCPTCNRDRINKFEDLESWEDLKGKTIESICYRKAKYFDDMPFLDIIFTDGLKITIEATYGSFTGKSSDAYPCYLNCKEFGFDYDKPPRDD